MKKKRIRTYAVAILILEVGMILWNGRSEGDHTPPSAGIEERKDMTEDVSDSEQPSSETDARLEKSIQITELTNGQKEKVSETESETEPETETEPPVVFRENREISQYTKVIMVGDSRFVGMSTAVSFPGCVWICETSMGYDWLASTAAEEIDRNISKNSAIVFNLGVNDIARFGEYANFLNTKVEGWTSAGADVYFMSINPVDDGYSGSVTNADIETFNSVMTANLSPWFGYIDTYGDMAKNGFTSRDGLHYTNETYVSIFQYCMNQLHVSIS